MNDDDRNVTDNWNNLPSYSGDYNDGYNWDSVSAKKFHEPESGVSSTTLTPNTEVDDGVGMVEMQEVNGGVADWARSGLSNASSDVLGSGEPMEISEDMQIKLEKADTKDVEMSNADADARGARTDPKVEHIEMVEEKGG